MSITQFLAGLRGKISISCAFGLQCTGEIRHSLASLITQMEAATGLFFTRTKVTRNEVDKYRQSPLHYAPSQRIANSATQLEQFCFVFVPF